MSKEEKIRFRRDDCGRKAATLTASQQAWVWIRNNTLFLGIASLVWLFLKSGRKPSRIQYPCQKAAAVNVGLFLLPVLASLLRRTYRYLRSCSVQQVIRFVVAACFSTGLLLSAVHLWGMHHESRRADYYKQLRSRGPFGKKMAGALGLAAGYLSIPHAMAIPSPHRVVSVHHAGATNWDFQCTGRGPCPVYYGSDDYVDQTIVDQMIDTGLQRLTDTESTEAAWEVILPDYQAGEIVAVKVNFNDAIAGGGASGYGDNDAYVDALPQIVNAVIAGLKGRGVAEEHIRVFDSSRYIPDRFRALIDYPDIRYFDRHGNGSDVEASTFDSADPSAQVAFPLSQYPASSSTHKISDVLVESDYLINIPIMKKHGGAGITLSLKNHLGSINGFTSGGHAMHSYFYLNGSNYSDQSNPMVDINNNDHIKNKTVLIVGDALYAGWSSNNTPPERWEDFNKDSPNLLFFAVDPVAVDSVMFDYIDREGWVNPASEDLLVLAGEAGLGVHERWNNDEDRSYTQIDYIEIDLDDTQAPTVPSGLTAVAASAGRIDLSWSPATDPGGRMGGYRIYRNGTFLASTADTNYSDTGLLPTTEYTYTVSAYDAADNESGLSDPAATTTEADTVAPNAPTDLTAIAVSSSEINLSWTAADDNIGVIGYHIYRNGDFSASVDQVGYTDTGLAAATQYPYTVTAYDASDNESRPSAEVTAATLAQDPPGGSDGNSSGGGGCFIDELE